MRGTKNDNVERVAEAIRKRGTYPFSAWEIAEELSLCRQTVYICIRKLNELGHRIEGLPNLGFMARMKEAA